MKRSLFFIVFIVISMIAKAQFVEYTPVNPDNSRSTPIVPRYSDPPFVQWTPPETPVVGTTYNAVVFYESSTGYENTYRLPVVVRNGSVDKIIFNDNGGCVHVGVNTSGYKYYGGKLEYIKDLDAYATEVTIVYDNDRWQKYTVVIQ